MSGGNKNGATVADILKQKKLEENKQSQKIKRQEEAEQKKLTLIKIRQQEQKKQIIEEIRKVYIPSIACQKTGISRATLYRWISDDYEFNKEFSRSRLEGRNGINDIAESKLIGRIRDDDIKATMFWLTHMHPNFVNPKISITEEEKEKPKLSLERMIGIANRLKQWKNDNLK